MPASTKPPTTTRDERKPQIDKFREAARELETDQSEEAFDRVLRKVTKAEPPKDRKDQDG